MEERYRYWFASNLKVSHKKKIRLLQEIGTEKEVYNRQKIEGIKGWDLVGEYEKFVELGGRFVTINDLDYPQSLREIDNPPFALFYKGKLPQKERMNIAIVGARRCSGYGYKIAKEFAKGFGELGVQVTSGMALGIDATAQRSALEAGGESYAVLGCGVDICYPKENKGLYQDLIQKGGVISEFPLGSKPERHNFPLRNRIISGLSDVIIVIEAKEKSGSLITADCAMEQGKDVYALPGMITSELSIGCNKLIREGAGILVNFQEFLEEIGINYQISLKKPAEKKIILENKENMVYSGLDFQVRNIEWILQQFEMPIHELLGILLSLEMKGLIKEVSKNNYRRQ